VWVLQFLRAMWRFLRVWAVWAIFLFCFAAPAEPSQKDWPVKIQKSVELAKRSGFYVSVLYRESRGKPQYIVILGEIHNQGPLNQAKGKELLSLFKDDAIGFEESRHGNYWSSFLFQSVAPSARKDFPHSTVIDVSHGDIQLGKTVWLEKDHHPDLWEELGRGVFPAGMLFVSGFATAAASTRCRAVQAAVAQDVSGKGQQTLKRMAIAQVFAGLSLMAGNAIVLFTDELSENPADSTTGNVGNRNVTMARNVETYMNGEEVPAAMLLTVGMGHNEGIAFHLRKAGFSLLYSQFGDFLDERTKQRVEKMRLPTLK